MQEANLLSISIVIPTYNRKDTLRQCLQAAISQDYDSYEIIVVDNGSTDGTGEMLRREFPQVSCLRQKQNSGPAAARNAGIHRASGSIIVFTDDDCVPPQNWLTRIAAGYARYPHVVGVGGYLEPPSEALKSNVLARYERHIARHVFHVGDSEYVGGFECPAGGTNNMSYRRTILQQVNGFDESFPYAAGEDADLKWRICQTHAQLLYTPIRVIHLQAYTWSAFKRQAYFRGKGRARFNVKHGPRTNHLRVSLRLIRRLLNFPLDLLNSQRRPFATIRLAEAWLNAHGEWNMLTDMRTWTS